MQDFYDYLSIATFTWVNHFNPSVGTPSKIIKAQYLPLTNSWVSKLWVSLGPCSQMAWPALQQCGELMTAGHWGWTLELRALV